MSLVTLINHDWHSPVVESLLTGVNAANCEKYRKRETFVKLNIQILGNYLFSVVGIGWLEHEASSHQYKVHYKAKIVLNYLQIC